MLTDTCCEAELKEKIADNALRQKQFHDVNTLMAELRRLLVRHGSVLSQEGIRKDILQLENWLEAERKGPAPVDIVAAGGITWLCALRDQLKLSADEALRLEGEGGNPSTKEQVEKTEALLKTIRRIDKIIDESSIAKPH